MSSDTWFIKPQVKINSKLKLICFPYAGGSAATYIPWTKWLPKEVELVAIQPPGRASRMFEPCYTNMNDLVENFIEVFISIIDRPYILFGHSMGSKIAFEVLSHCFKINSQLPSHFIASGSRAPHVPAREKLLYNLPEADFLLELKKLNGVPDEIISNHDLMSFYLPLIRSDFELAETYKTTSSNIYNCPVTIFGGSEDEDITEHDLISWGNYFSKPVNIKFIRGDHFFIESNEKMVSKFVNEIINSTIE